MMSATTASSPERAGQRRGDATRQALVDAALVEFAAVGFDAASTRAIATRAGVRQGQLTYHFDTKEALWHATVDHLFERFDQLLANAAPTLEFEGRTESAATIERSVRALVHAVARLPELNRIMVHEATAVTPRLEWIVEQHVRARFEQLADQWSAVQRDCATSLVADPIVIYYTVIGAASLLYVNTPEAHILLGREDIVDDQMISAHADLIVSMLLGEHKPTDRSLERN